MRAGRPFDRAAAPRLPETDPPITPEHPQATNHPGDRWLGVADPAGNAIFLVGLVDGLATRTQDHHQQRQQPVGSGQANLQPGGVTRAERYVS